MSRIFPVLSSPDAAVAVPVSDAPRAPRRLSLQKVLKGGKKLEFRAERDEECEDDEGNVYSKKTFEDLAKQGLVKKPAGV